jgi:hypothetical protein
MDNKKKSDSGRKNSPKIDPQKVIVVKPIYIKENRQFPSPVKK